MKALGPYFFAKTSMTRGLEMLDKISYNHKLYDWKLNFMQQYQAKWIPKINTLILSGEKDCITPPCLFLNDANFNQDNIHIKIINSAGHFPWIENLLQTCYEFEIYFEKYLSVQKI